MSRRMIGDVMPRPTRNAYQARCTMASCPWSFQDRTVEGAREALVAHARLEHPVPIPVFDGEDEDD